MKFSLVNQSSARWIGVVLLAIVSGSAIAQTTGSVDPNMARPGSPGTEEPPPGACTPIGVTVSGEIVFPFLCKDFIERYKTSKSLAVGGTDKPTDDSSAAAVPVSAPAVAVPESRPSSALTGTDQQKTAAKPSKAMVPQSVPVLEPGQRAVPPNGLEKKRRDSGQGPPGCVRFRSYDPVSKTYRDDLGRQRPCQS